MSREALFAALSQDDSNADAELAKVAVAADLAVLVHLAGLKRSDIAERLGWTRARVSQVLSGEGNLTIETIHAVAKAAGFAFDVVFREKGARRAVQMWERPLQLELEVNEAMSFAAPEHAVFESRWPAQVPMRWCAETPLVHVPGLRYEGFSYNAHVTPAPPFVIGTVKASA